MSLRLIKFQNFLINIFSRIDKSFLISPLYVLKIKPHRINRLENNMRSIHFEEEK